MEHYARKFLLNDGFISVHMGVTKSKTVFLIPIGHLCGLMII